jgi:hypothetical protein
VTNEIDLAVLDLSAEDASDLLSTMPSDRGDSEKWNRLQECLRVLESHLANRPGNVDPIPPAPPSTGLFQAHVVVAALEPILACHRAFGIPDDVSRETLAYLGRAMREYRQLNGEPGVRLTRWHWLRFLGWLYQVGRLEAGILRILTYPKEAGPLFWYDDEEARRRGAGFRRGDPAIALHIPAGGRLAPADCDESLRRVGTAFANVYPGEAPRIATCTSWLLDPQLGEYLAADSNILAFQQRFELAPGERDSDDEMLRFVFGEGRTKEIKALPQRTVLERAAVEHIQKGRHWRVRTGWLWL